MGGTGHGGGIEKSLKWNVLFFAGAVVTFTAGLMSVIYWIANFSMAPATFMSEFFLLVFGLLMMVLDLPIPHPHKGLVAIRDACYKFVLFMTRFTGRGMWYLFLSTMVFGSLYDDKLNVWLGVVFTLYLFLLGAGALFQGWYISTKLNGVRNQIISSGRTPEHFIARGSGAVSKEQFKCMVEEVTHQPCDTTFSNDELDYIINALSFTPYNNGCVSHEEFEYWLRESSVILMV